MHHSEQRHAGIYCFTIHISYSVQWTAPLILPQKNLLVVTYLIIQVSSFLLGAKLKLKSYKDQSFNLETENYLAAFELVLKFVNLSRCLPWDLGMHNCKFLKIVICSFRLPSPYTSWCLLSLRMLTSTKKFSPGRSIPFSVPCHERVEEVIKKR